MTVFLIIIGIAIIGIIIFKAGGKEIDKIVSAQGGFKSIYADVIRGLSLPAGGSITEKSPSNIIIDGTCQIRKELYSYKWRLYTLDGRKLSIKFILRNCDRVVEEKLVDFPIGVSSVKILATLHGLIEHKEVFPQ